jgi:hypothetical protein
VFKRLRGAGTVFQHPAHYHPETHAASAVPLVLDLVNNARTGALEALLEFGEAGIPQLFSASLAGSKELLITIPSPKIS